MKLYDFFSKFYVIKFMVVFCNVCVCVVIADVFALHMSVCCVSEQYFIALIHGNGPYNEIYKTSIFFHI